jgi:hypothetical protein
VEIATLDVRSRKPFQHGASYFQRQAALCEQTDDFDRARNMALDEREFSRVRYLGGHVFSHGQKASNTIKILPEKPPYGPRIKVAFNPADRFTGVATEEPATGHLERQRARKQVTRRAGRR